MHPVFPAASLLAALLLLDSALSHAGEPASQCFGSTAAGRLENGWALPGEGPNFQAYSQLAALAGRTYVHSRVHAVVVDAYARLQQSAPEVRYVYGETGWRQGGPFAPHKTHQNGLSVDFFVPVRNAQGDSTLLPIGLDNRLGYDIEFDQQGRYAALHIDYPAMARHLWALHAAARQQGIAIQRVIFDPVLLAQLLASKEGRGLDKVMYFSPNKPWVRHDEHYHIDFQLPCKP